MRWKNRVLMFDEVDWRGMEDRKLGRLRGFWWSKSLNPVRKVAGRNVLRGWRTGVAIDLLLLVRSFFRVFFLLVSVKERRVDVVAALVVVEEDDEEASILNPGSRSAKRALSPCCPFFFVSVEGGSAVMILCLISCRSWRLRSISFCISCLNSTEKTAP